MEDASGYVPEQLPIAAKELHDTYHSAICDCCDFPILGIRYKCINCADYDLCTLCYERFLKPSSANTVHFKHHLFLVITRPLPAVADREDRWKEVFPLPCLVAPEDAAQGQQLHRGVFCVRCKGCVLGSRFVCLNCVDMFTLCERCETLGPDGKDGAGVHYNGRNHVMLRVPFAPRNAVYRDPHVAGDDDADNGSVNMVLSSDGLNNSGFEIDNNNNNSYGNNAGRSSGGYDAQAAFFSSTEMRPVPDDGNAVFHQAMFFSSGGGGGGEVFSSMDSSASGSVPVDPDLLKTPLNAVGVGDLARPGFVFSKVPGDLQFPLIPVPWVGENAIDGKLVNTLAKSAEGRHGRRCSGSSKPRAEVQGPVVVREASQADLAAINEIEADSFAHPFQPEFFRAMLRKGNYFLWVAETVLTRPPPAAPTEFEKERGFFEKLLGKKPQAAPPSAPPANAPVVVGYIAIRLSEDFCDIQSIAVGSACRGLGVGRKLLMKAIELAEIYHCPNCKLHVSVFNGPAMSLYKSVGFLPSAWVVNYYSRENEDGIVMIRKNKTQ